eukprot:CAMPEP_0177186902 /NCGR_PEP_ID=MMETSP0367-20130122/18905_1 /TAXON_ID=447022 ORGANISM="Scrippsiella hangoei-like, Strain SHHI-4" /NCGR_SAMPLE_ID=MMETSP0367 /ASSEMBLY_ACC=CAM_ASM_000362 /LENGTH=269 /DNA_ID=CAMNT_0018634249 /DNA_START=69 /DNA_END=876 /DNA_ORIENTATION=+
MAQQIEGSAAKPSFFSRVGTSIATTARSNFRPGAGLYSLCFGAAAGVAISGFVYVGRTMQVMLFDHEYYKLQSRKRYYEKQLIFTREQEETQAAHYLGAMAAEYDPAATRMPFKPLEPSTAFEGCLFGTAVYLDQQVFAIVRGKKLLENRGWRIPLGWHAIHAGSQLINDERAERTRQAWPDAPRESDLPHGAVIGLFHIKEHRRPNQCKDGYIWARGPVCHVISKAIELPRPVRCSGGSGLWTLPGDVREEIRAQMRGPEAPEVRQFD